MRARLLFACVVTGAALAAPPAHAQELPPPPLPPMTAPTNLPPPPPPPPSPSQPPPSTRPAAPRYEPAPQSPPPPARGPRSREVAVVYEEPPARPFAVTFNPVALTLGRLSANLELLVAPHHALVLSPNLLAFQFDRGGRYDLRSEALGFATQRSDSFGVELGYHYWWHWRRTLSGPFFGPSLLLGSATNASVGGTTNAQAYWGAALDAGGQAVLPGGLTLGAGLGLGFVAMASQSAVFPRLLLQVGWSF